MKNYSRLFITITASALSLGAMAQTPAWPEWNNSQRPGARWWWMGSAINKENTDYLIGEYSKCGIGTLEITPIYGVKNATNNIEYLTNNWFTQYNNVLSAAKENGVQIDMNMGTGWPFGGPSVTLAEAAGKLVYTRNDMTCSDEAPTITVTNIRTSNKTVTNGIVPGTPASEATLNIVMAFPNKISGTTASDTVDVTQYVSGNTLTWTPEKKGSYYILALFNDHTKQMVKRPAPGGAGYVMDHLDSAAVANYIKVFEKAFTRTGAQYPTCFFNDSYEIFGANWSRNFLKEFEKYRGYQMQRWLPSLFGITSDTRKINGKNASNCTRADYRQTMADMYLNNFIKPWNEFCHNHGVLTRNQSHGSPSNLVDTYASVDIPEIEGYGMTPLSIKGLRIDKGFTATNSSDFPTLKLAASAAHMTGKKIVSSETFTWFTEHFRTSLSQMKPELDLMFLAGVNRIMFHGTTYSPKNAAWPGNKFYASMDMSPTNSIWYDAPNFMKYAQRCQSFLQMGQPDNDVLVYYNVYSSWHISGDGLLRLTAISDFKSQYGTVDVITDSLDNFGYGVDYITDKMIQQLKVEDGMIVTPQGLKYKILVLPMSASAINPGANIEVATKEKIDEMVAQGVKVVYNKKALADYSTIAAPEPMCKELGLRFIRRSNDTGYHYFISNLTDHDVASYVKFGVSFTSAAIFNPMDSTIRQALVNDEGKVYMHLRSGESMILQTYNTDITSPTLAKDADESTITEKEIALDGAWTLSFDKAKLADASDFTATYALEAPKTWENIDDKTSQLMGQGTYSTSVNLTAEQLKDASDVRIILGDVRESARVYINKEYAGTAWSVPFELSVGKLLKEGTNEISIEVTNLPANRIRQMDVNGTVWRIFEDANIATISSDNNVGTTSSSFAGWALVPSGLNSAVSLKVLYGGTTAVNSVLGDTENATSSDWYNLNGMKVAKPTTAGIYINNHRKVVIR